jgi:hypothetical protein
MSFQSPLFKRPGAEDGTSHSPATLDDEFLRRRRTPGTTERPVGSPLFSNNNNATAHQFQRPSPLGLNFQSQGEGGATTTPSGRYLGGGSSRTPSSTGTNFKARLQAMQTTKSNTATAAGTPTGAGFRLPSTPSSTTGLARPGQLGPLSSSTRGASTTSIFLAKQQHHQRLSGPPPPVSSLEDELLNLKLDLTTGRDRDDVDTPIKSGMKLNLGTASSRLTTTPTATTTKTPSGDDNGNVSKAGALPSLSFHTGNTTPVGLTTITKGTWTKGKKAVGAGALAVARSPLPGGGGGGDSLVVSSTKDTTVVGLSIPVSSSTDVADKHVYGIIEKLPPQEKDEKEIKTSAGVNDARSLQRRLRSQLPEFGISEWSPPVPTAKAVLPSTTATSIEKTGALKELATLRNQAEVKLEGAFISRIIGGETPSPLPMSSSQQQQQLCTTEELALNKEESKEEDDDVLCRGIRSAFRSTLPELQIPSATPEAAAMPSSSSISTRSTSLSPLERGTRRGAGGSGAAVEKKQGRVVADEIEERLERLKLLRNQAVQVTSTSTTTPINSRS